MTTHPDHSTPWRERNLNRCLVLSIGALLVMTAVLGQAHPTYNRFLPPVGGISLSFWFLAVMLGSTILYEYSIYRDRIDRNEHGENAKIYGATRGVVYIIVTMLAGLSSLLSPEANICVLIGAALTMQLTSMFLWLASNSSS